jgi:signal peptidase I
MDRTKRRNPVISFLLSFVLPGLGHMYNGRLGEGILFCFGCWLVVVLTVTGLSGLACGLWSLICIIVAPILICQILICTHAAIEAARLKVVPLKWYNKWYVYVCAILLASFVWKFMFYAITPFARHHAWGRPFKSASSSMVPTLEEGDHFVAKMQKYGDRLPRRGDIVIFPYPEDRSKNFVMRAIGLPGERIEIKDKAVLINGERVYDPWGFHFDSRTFPERDNFGPIDIPEGSVFVLGDNRDFSHDSRFWGYVGIKDIEGKALFIYWSNDLNRIGKKLD